MGNIDIQSVIKSMAPYRLNYVQMCVVYFQLSSPYCVGLGAEVHSYSLQWLCETVRAVGNHQNRGAGHDTVIIVKVHLLVRE